MEPPSQYIFILLQFANASLLNAHKLLEQMEKTFGWVGEWVRLLKNLISHFKGFSLPSDLTMLYYHALGNVEHLDLTGHIWDYKPDHASLHNEFVHDGKPILILPSSSACTAPYDDDP